MIEVRNITDFNEYLESLLAETESDDLEFKSAAGGFPESFWETYSAFANTDGGTIVFGVAEKRDGLYLDGLTDEQIEKYKKDFWNNANNSSTISCNLLKTGDVQEVEYKGYKFILFFIPRASRHQRPVHRTPNPFKGTYKRNNEGDYKCTEREVRRMFADADDESPTDSRILRNYSLDDLDQEALTRYRQLFKLSSPNHPWLALGDIELLTRLGGYRKDRVTQEEGFTVAGLLMFGKTHAITDVECCPNFFPDYQERLTEDDSIRWTNRICADGTWEANLFNFYHRVLPRLQTVLPKPFNLKNNIRREETPAHVAVREAMVNVCIHADYTENASLLVKHTATGFIFSNPGTMLVSKDQYYNGGDSVCRNKSLQKMFSMLGIAEKAGSGSDKIIKGWRDSNWPSPYIKEQSSPDKVILTMSRESLLSEKAQNELREKFGISANSFDHNVTTTLAIASDEGYVTNERLRYALNLHKAEISELLKLMVKSQLLCSEGYGRGTKYHLPENWKHILRAEVAEDSTDSASSEPYSASNSASSEPYSASNSASSEPYSASNSASSEPYSASNSASSEPYSASNSASSEPYSASNSASSDVSNSSIRRKRLSKSQLHALIQSVCQDWISLEEIVIKTKKSSSYLRNNVIPLMVAEGSLEMLFPNSPRSPQQRYKVKE